MQYNNAGCKGNRKLSVYQLPHAHPAGSLQRNIRELCRKDAPLARYARKNAVELRVART
jgi:hypothetical protein